MAKQKNGKTYEELAVFHNHPHFSTLITELRLRTAIMEDRFDEIKTLADTLPVDALCRGDEAGNTPLHHLAKKKTNDLATLFLFLGKLPKQALFAQNKNHTTPVDAGMMISNHLIGSAISTVFALLKDQKDDMSLENLLGKELAKQLFEKLFPKPKGEALGKQS